MQIVQKKRSNKHTFTFKDDLFNFAYEDKNGSGDVDIDYVDFPQKFSIRIEQNEWLRNVGYLWCAIGALQFGYAVYSAAPLSGKGFWLFLGLGSLAWAHFSKVKYSVFQTDHGSVFVIQDKRHDEIISELNARRRKQLLQGYGEINFSNDPQKEINKFRWLSEQNALSREEAEIKIAQVELAHKASVEMPGLTLN